MSRRFTLISTLSNKLFDLYANNGFGFSLRLLTYLYTGPCLRVRSGTANAEGDLYFNPNERIGFDSLITITAAGTSGLTVGVSYSLLTFLNAGGSNQSVYCSRWYEQGGSGIYVYQNNGINQPRLVNSGTLETKNSKVALRFVLANKAFFEFADPSSNSIFNYNFRSFTNFTRAAFGDASATTEILFSKTVNAFAVDRNALYSESGNLQLLTTSNGGANQSLAFGGKSTDNKLYSQEYLNNATNKIYVENMEVALGPATTLGNSSFRYLIGAYNSPNNTDEPVAYYNGYMQEHVLYRDNITANRDAISNNIISAW